MIDDMSVIPRAEYDLKMQSAWLTMEDPLGIEYYVTPKSQMPDEMLIVAEVYNYGYIDDDGAILNGGIDDQDIYTSIVYDLEVIAVDDAPETSDLDNLITDEDQSLEIILVANDEETDESLVFDITSPPSSGVITSSRALGYFTYTPTQDFYGTDEFEFSVTDGNSTTTGNGSIVVNPINDPPKFLELALSNATEDSDIYLFDLKHKKIRVIKILRQVFQNIFFIPLNLIVLNKANIIENISQLLGIFKFIKFIFFKKKSKNV